jgi:hypothetical protein
VPASITRRKISGTSRSGVGRSWGSLSDGALTGLGYLALALSSNAASLGCEPTHVGPNEQRGAEGDRIVIVEPDDTVPAPSSSVVHSVSALVEPYCARGYPSSGSAAMDVLRLSALCAGTNGLLASESIELGPELKVSKPLRLELGPGDCVWAVAASEPKGAPLRVRWLDGDRPLAECTLDGCGWCPAAEPLCVARSRSLQLTLELPEGELARARVWRRYGPK